MSNLQDSDNDQFHQNGKMWDARSFTKVSLVSISIVGVIGWILLTIFTKPVPLPTGKTFSLSLFWLLAIFAYAVGSYRFWDPVPTDKNAALTIFYRPAANIGAGAPYAPLYIVKVILVSANVLQREFPAEPEMIDRSELKEGYRLDEGKKPPLRIQFTDSISDDKARMLFGEDYTVKGVDGDSVSFVADVSVDGLSKRVTAEVHHVVRLLINNPCLFLRNIGSEEEAFRQIEDEMVAVLYRYYTRMSVAQALANVRWMSILLYQAVERRVGARGDIKSWGVDVQAAFVKNIHTDHGLNIAISEAAQAPFQKDKTIIAAEGAKQDLILKGDGTAHAARKLEMQTLEGRAIGISHIAKKLGVRENDALAAEVAREVAKGGNAIIVGTEGITQIAGIAAAFTQGRNTVRNANRETDES